MKPCLLLPLLISILDLVPQLGAQPLPAPAAAAPAVRLTILGDNAVARGRVKAIWGFACLVETRGHTILFDTGADPAVLKDNLAVLNIDPARIEAVVISHVHGDHTWGAPGLGTLPGVRVYTPRSFDGRPREVAALEAAGLRIVPVSTATPLFEGVTISEPLRFGGPAPSRGTGRASAGETWEQCLAADTPDGLVVVVGCSHPGLLPMLEQVKRLTGRPLHLVLGGFHLFNQPEVEVRRIAAGLRAMGVAHVGPAHCTGEAAAHVFRDVFGEGCVSAGVGAVIDVPRAVKKP